MDRQDFDRAIGVAPPSTVDVDAVIARGRRAGFVGRMTSPWVATSLAVIAVTFGTAALLLPHDSGGGGVPAAPPSGSVSTTPSPPSTTPTRTPCEASAPTGPAMPEESKAAAQRLSGALNSEVRAKLPAGAKLTASSIAKDLNGKRYGALEAYHIFSEAAEIPNGCKLAEDYFMARAVVTQGTKKGNILAVIGRLGGNTTPRTKCDTDVISVEETDCTREVRADGMIVVKVTLSLDGATVNRVEVTKPDGTGIIMHAENVAEDAKNGGPPESPKPPLTHEQLVQVASSEKVTLYPTN